MVYDYVWLLECIVTHGYDCLWLLKCIVTHGLWLIMAIREHSHLWFMVDHGYLNT